MVRLFRAFDPTPMLDRPGGHLAVQDAARADMHYDLEFRREEATSAVGSNAKH